eukprot:Hpha_TRINITY_DN16501_c2_g6::TRINITY_DN16501_c2_g6_i1::g.137194::m.137194/K08857/NEK1_4_5; NIMA (never in mitosis gene a)-related kinase 1/4/5
MSRAVAAAAAAAAGGSHERYERVRMLGKGSYGQVFLMRDRDNGGRTCVMKVIDLSGMQKKDREEARGEAVTLEKIDHEHIIKYIDSFVSPNGRTLSIVTEHAAKGDLERLISSRMGRRLPDETIARIFYQTCLAVTHLHERHILHRDLKPANIFIAGDGSVKIGDFGLAKVLAHTMQCAKTACGTPYYMAPEICQERPYHNRSDVWALGCILYNMASGGKQPFDARDLKDLFRRINYAQPDPLPSGVSADLKTLIGQLIQRDPLTRPAVSQILSSPFLARHGFGPAPRIPSPVPSAQPSAAAAQPQQRGIPPPLRQQAPLGGWERGRLPPPRRAPEPIAPRPDPLRRPSPVPSRVSPVPSRVPSQAPSKVPIRAGGQQSAQPQWWHQDGGYPPYQAPHHLRRKDPLMPPARLQRVDYAAMLGAQRAELEVADQQYKNWRAARAPPLAGPARERPVYGGDRDRHAAPSLPPLSKAPPRTGMGMYEHPSGVSELPPLHPYFARA